MADTTSPGTPPPAAAQARLREEWQRWSRGAAPSAGYVVPYRYAGQLQPPPPPPWLLDALEAAVPRMTRWLDAARGHGALLSGLDRGRDDDPDGPRFDQDWFSGLDATLAYTAVRELRPRLLLEVGSGHSTRFLARAIRDGATATRLVSLDPAPRRDIDVLCDAVHRMALGVAALPHFAALRSGDVLFLDGSHLLMPGTDVDLMLSHVLPTLPDGCIVHVHDIFLPDPYPLAWRWRGYNEQQAWCAWLGTGRAEILAASAWLRRHRPGLLDGVHAPCPGSAYESSLWLRLGQR